MRKGAAGTWEANGARRGQNPRRQRDAPFHRQALGLAGGGVERHHGAHVVAAATDEGDPRGGAHEAPVAGAANRQRRREALRQVRHHQLRHPRFDALRHHMARPHRHEAAGVEAPQRHTVLGFVRHGAVNARLVIDMQIPETVGVGHVSEPAIVQPLRLADGFRGAARHHRGFRQGPGSVEAGDDQLRAVPRHVGVVPNEEGELVAVRREARAGIEIVAARQHFDGAIGDIHAHQVVDRFVAHAVALAHRDEAAAALVPDQPAKALVNAAEGHAARHRAVQPHRVDVLILEVDEPRHAVRHGERATAVLVYPAAGVERRRREVAPLAVPIPHEGRAAAFGRAHLQPVERAIPMQEVGEGDERGQHEVRRDRRRPSPVAGHFGNARVHRTRERRRRVPGRASVARASRAAQRS